MLAIDTETTGVEWFSGDVPFLATASDYDRDFLFHLEDHPSGETDAATDIEQLRDALKRTKRLIAHNMNFDAQMLVSSGVISLDSLLRKELHDTDILARIVLGEGNRTGTHAGGFGLKVLATSLLDPEAGKPEQEIKERMLSMGLIRRPDQRNFTGDVYRQVWHAYPELMETYAVKDTRYAYDLWYLLWDQATDDHKAVYELEMRLLPHLIRAEHTGIAVDPERVEELHAEYAAKEEALRAQLYALNDGPFNPDSPDEVVAYLQRQGVELTVRSETGNLRTDKGVLEGFREVPAVGLLLDYRQASKFITTYLEPMRGRNQIHPQFWQIGAWTGRMSCSRPNMQNMPVRGGSELRSMIVPRSGHSFIVADYSSIELRLLAYYMNSPELWSIINTGDPFLWLGEQIFKSPDQETWPVSRSQLKNGFYAMMYGAGGPKLAATIGGGMSAEDGRRLRKAIEKALGERYTRLQARIKEALRERGHVVTLGRRVQRVPVDRAYVGLNSLIQGSAADIIKMAVPAAAEAIAPLGGTPLLFVHDEIVAEVPTENADEALAAMVAAMTGVTDRLDLQASGVVCHQHYGEAK